MNRFPMTTAGYLEAVKYLKSIGEYDRYANSSENDGFSIIAAANYQYEKKAKLVETNIG